MPRSGVCSGASPVKVLVREAGFAPALSRTGMSQTVYNIIPDLGGRVAYYGTE
ncbi:MAG: hypothetical protein KIT45_07840 [Fimbriimonadia bacterium]|nr:hypothetical protein [Fimbriimonadia bacterium]